jgi:hypothetical protein
MTDDLRSDAFAAQQKPVRERFIQKLFITLEAQGRAASRALDEIQKFADSHLPSGTAQILRANRSVTLFRMEGLDQTVGSDQP